MGHQLRRRNFFDLLPLAAVDPRLAHARPHRFFLTTRHRYKKYYAPTPINSEEMWELEKAARKHAEDKAFDESRAIVPKHVETDEPSPDNKNQTP